MQQKFVIILISATLQSKSICLTKIWVPEYISVVSLAIFSRVGKSYTRLSKSKEAKWPYDSLYDEEMALQNSLSKKFHK